MQIKEAIKQLWIRKMEKDYLKKLSAKKVSYDTYVREKEEEYHFGEETGPEGFTLYVQRNGQLNRHALTWIWETFQANPEAMVVYGDEDFLNADGTRENPWYKPCWSPDTYLSQFYVGSVIAVRADREADAASPIRYFDGPEEIRQVLMPFLQKAGGFSEGCSQRSAILRCPHILFHAREASVWESYLCSKERQEQKTDGRDLLPEEKEEPGRSLISCIIPSKDNPRMLRICIDSLRCIENLEIIVVDNGSNEENRAEIERLTKGMHYIYSPMEFHFSRMCNLGVAASTGQYLLFLNDDIQVLGSRWLERMKEKAALPYAGAVGLKLYYPDSNRIQHAGITNLPQEPVHKMQFAEDKDSIYFGRNKADFNCLAVTGACLMVEKDKYLKCGGLKDALGVAYNDVELCFALYEAGYQNVVINSEFAYHHESLSRGKDESKEKQARLNRERALLYEMHPALRGKDPYYPTGLSRDGLDAGILPEYIHSRNRAQKAKISRLAGLPGDVREDPCLFVGIELCDHSYIKGYGVVLGDNNACYDRYIVLAADQVFLIKTEGCYRQELKENMPDQKHVELCGFWVELPKGAFHPEEEYRVGVMAVNRMNGTKLLNWSGQSLRIQG